MRIYARSVPMNIAGTDNPSRNALPLYNKAPAPYNGQCVEAALQTFYPDSPSDCDTRAKGLPPEASPDEPTFQ